MRAEEMAKARIAWELIYKQRTTLRGNYPPKPGLGPLALLCLLTLLLNPPCYTVLSKLDPNSPLHIVVNSCLTTTYYTMAHLGRFTLHTLRSFEPQIHILPSGIHESIDHEGLKSTGFHLPKTKTGGPEVVSWAAQHGWTHPWASLKRHLQVNCPPQIGPLFMYHFKDRHRPLTKTNVLEVACFSAKSAGLDPFQDHGICIRSTLEYLLQGMPFNVMKVQGCWASDSFTLYLCKYAQILALYLQAAPLVHEALLRYTMPPVHWR